MTRNDQLADVIRMACLTECRTDAEQRSLMAWAWDVDREHNNTTVTNTAKRDIHWRPTDLVTLVDQTRELEDGDRRVPFPKRWDETWERWREDWEKGVTISEQ